MILLLALPSRLTWSSPAEPLVRTPGLADLGWTASEAARYSGHDILLLQQGAVRLALDRQNARGGIPGVRFVTGLLVVPATIETVRARLHRPLSRVWGDDFHIDIAQWRSAAGQATYQEEQSYPLPIGHWHVRLLMRQTDIDAYSWQRQLIQGPLTASISRYELFAVDSQHTLIVLTHWSRIDADTWFYRLLLRAQPQIGSALPWMVVASTLEATRRQFAPWPGTTDTPYLDGALRIHAPTARQAALQWVSLDADLKVDAATALQRLGEVDRYPEFLHMLRQVRIESRGGGIQLTRWQLQIDLGLWHIRKQAWLYLQKTPDSLHLWLPPGPTGERMEAYWQISAAGPTLSHTRLSIASQGLSLGWMLGVLRYSPYPQIDEPLIASRLIVLRGRRWLLHTH